MKRLLGAVFLAAVVAVPKSAEAQPLRTLCATPAQLFCLNVLTFEFSQNLTQDVPGGGMRGSQRFDTTFEPFGGGFFDSPVTIIAWLTPEYLYGGDSLFGVARVTAPGTYATLESSPGTNVARPPTVFDVGYQFSGTDGLFLRCGPQRGGAGGAPDCVEVPEPGTYLLLLTGVIGLGFAVCRRREETLA